VGLVPENEAFAQWAGLNQWGYFSVGEDCMTETPGLFVAGDCRSKQIRQVVTAAADGAVAATAACLYLDKIRTYIWSISNLCSLP
jgi:thioredoxin reductase (NADPH)